MHQEKQKISATSRTGTLDLLICSPVLKPLGHQEPPIESPPNDAYWCPMLSCGISLVSLDVSLVSLDVLMSHGVS